MIQLCFVSLLLATGSDNYGDIVSQLNVQTAKRLAEANSPNESGAIGRNKKAYFHVRFQLGMHHIADFGLATKQPKVIERFLDSVEYSLEHQLPSGEFSLVVPDALKEKGVPSIADRASGVAFFVSSLGLGIHALETNQWFTDSPSCAVQRKRLAEMTSRLAPTLGYLLKHTEYLESADRLAPNRLLFDALALETLGRILNDEEAIKVGATFVAKAIKQVHPTDGHFIEGGGFDSSYNAVATALALRLLMIGHKSHELSKICENSIGWQKQRVLDSGEVSTQGNSRVRPGKSGESFLGREKDVDVGHVVEAFMLASIALADDESQDIAESVIAFYESKRRERR